MSDDIDELIDEFRKYFNLDSNSFEIDFLFIPESKTALNSKHDEKEMKGFKISYHFETGMEKPEIKIEGNIDEKRIREQLKDVDLNKYPNLKKILDSKIIEEIDAGDLSLESPLQEDDYYTIEPYTEIINKENSIEIVFEIPGMEENDVRVDFSEEDSRLLFFAKNKERKYTKIIPIVYKSPNVDYNLEVNNGLAILRVNKANK